MVEKLSITYGVLMPEKYFDTYYDDQDHKTWSHLYKQQLMYMRDTVDLGFLQNLVLLKTSGSYISNLSQISDTLKAAIGWDVVGVKGLLKPLKFFELLSKELFPSTIYMK